MKRYIRIDLEYESDSLASFTTMDNLKRIIQEDMPYAKVIFSRDTPDKDRLDAAIGSRG